MCVDQDNELGLSLLTSWLQFGQHAWDALVKEVTRHCCKKGARRVSLVILMELWTRVTLVILMELRTRVSLVILMELRTSFGQDALHAVQNWKIMEPSLSYMSTKMLVVHMYIDTCTGQRCLTTITYLRAHSFGINPE